jgi:anti-anti-sigma factor
MHNRFWFTWRSTMQMTLARPQDTSYVSPAIIRFEGALNADNAVELQRLLSAAVLSNHHSSLLLDMQQVDQIDSAGLMVLVGGFRLAQRTNKRFCLCSVSRSVQIILELTQLDKVLEIFETSPIVEAIAN